MNRHFSSSAPFTWLRNKVFKIKKPYALGWDEWGKWDEKLKSEKPFAFFMTETLPEWLEYIPKYTIDHVYNLKYYINNRWVSKTHAMSSNLEKGKWHEFETRLLHSMFDEFVDFIEIETAWSHIVWDKEARKKYEAPFWSFGWFRWRTWRCPEAALDHIKWEQTLTWDKFDDEGNVIEDPASPRTAQAIAADEKLALYLWWKETRPARGDSWVATGFRAFWDSMDAKYDRGSKGSNWLGLGGKQVMTKQEQKEYKRLSKANDKLEQSWDKEDEEMMTRLIKLRKSLWT
jgi:hypothetical protein